MLRLIPNTKSMTHKKIDKLNFIIIKNLHYLKGFRCRIKLLTMKQLFLNHVTNKRLIFRLHKKLFTVNGEKANKIPKKII